jgi:hypothetical protein
MPIDGRQYEVPPSDFLVLYRRRLLQTVDHIAVAVGPEAASAALGSVVDTLAGLRAGVA